MMEDFWSPATAKAPLGFVKTAGDCFAWMTAVDVWMPNSAQKTNTAMMMESAHLLCVLPTNAIVMRNTFVFAMAWVMIQP